jgi:hypothetical protein
MTLHIDAKNFENFVEGLLSLNVLLEASFSLSSINFISYQLGLLTILEGDNSLFLYEVLLPTLEVCEL